MSDIRITYRLVYEMKRERSHSGSKFWCKFHLREKIPAILPGFFASLYARRNGIQIAFHWIDVSFIPPLSIYWRRCRFLQRKTESDINSTRTYKINFLLHCLNKLRILWIVTKSTLILKKLIKNMRREIRPTKLINLIPEMPPLSNFYYLASPGNTKSELELKSAALH